MYQPENQSPPLGEGHPLSAIRAKARNYRRAGTDVGEILQASQRLAHAQVCATFGSPPCMRSFTPLNPGYSSECTCGRHDMVLGWMIPCHCVLVPAAPAAS